MYTTDNKNILISFEDHNDDQNFSDVVLAMTTFPDDAFADVISLNRKDNTTKLPSNSGVYAFEDQWPSKGDYDMNDVMVNLSTSRLVPSDNDNSNALGESFDFSVYQNVATLKNGLAFTLEEAIQNATYTMYIDDVETPFAEIYQNKIFYITDNVKNIIGKKISVKATYTLADRVDQNHITKVLPFVYRKEADDTYREVHLPKEAPTERASMTFFGQEDDRSDISKKEYYVRSGNYPFAFYLAGATTDNVSSMLDSANESKSIDILYSGYAKWVETNGQENPGWYK